MQGIPEYFSLIERKIDRVQSSFTGVTADLDNLRRHYRETLDKLPIGVCSIGADGEILLWNRGMQQITGVSPREVIGSLLDSLPSPWQQIIRDFRLGNSNSLLKTEVAQPGGQSRWVSLLKTDSSSSEAGVDADTVILVEDITDFELLEKELLHNERLASIGRLAAGVAHEIGNPVTGIACLAQNLEYETDPDEILSLIHISEPTRPY